MPESFEALRSISNVPVPVSVPVMAIRVGSNVRPGGRLAVPSEVAPLAWNW